MTNNTYRYRRNSGTCPLCGKEPQDGYVCCRECREKEKMRQREDRAFYRSINICPICRKNKLFGDEKTCPECLARFADINKRSRDRIGKTYMSYYRERQQKLLGSGLCRSGCGRKRAEGHTYCEICLEKQRERSKKYRAKQKMNYVGIQRNERSSYGFCYTCGQPLDRDGRICLKCAEKATKNLPSARKTDHWQAANRIIFKSN